MEIKTTHWEFLIDLELATFDNEEEVTIVALVDNTLLSRQYLLHTSLTLKWTMEQNGPLSWHR